MRASSRQLVLGGLLILAGCGGKAAIDPNVVYRDVPVVVTVGCVVDRPDEVPPLNKQVTPDQWSALAPGAKAQAVLAQAGTRLNYEDSLRAATSGCRPKN